MDHGEQGPDRRQQQVKRRRSKDEWDQEALRFLVAHPSGAREWRDTYVDVASWRLVSKHCLDGTLDTVLPNWHRALTELGLPFTVNTLRQLKVALRRLNRREQSKDTTPSSTTSR